MDIVPRIGRPQRRDLLQMARKISDLGTALRLLIVARLGLRKTSSEVASELDVARSTVVRTAHRYAEQGLAGLYDKRRDNGNPKVTMSFGSVSSDFFAARRWTSVGRGRPGPGSCCACRGRAKGSLPSASARWAASSRTSARGLGCRNLSSCARGSGMPASAAWPSSARSKPAPAPRSPCCTPTKLTSISTPRSGAIGCSAGNNAASSPRARTRSSTWQKAFNTVLPADANEPPRLFNRTMPLDVPPDFARRLKAAAALGRRLFGAGGAERGSSSAGASAASGSGTGGSSSASSGSGIGGGSSVASSSGTWQLRGEQQRDGRRLRGEQQRDGRRRVRPCRRQQSMH